MFPKLTVHASRRPKAAIAREPYVNFAYGRIAAAPAPPLTGTAFTLQPGHASRFPPPPFSASLWAYAEPPEPATAEVVHVQAVSGDTFTVLRAQEGTTPRAIVAGDQISANVTAGDMNAIGFWRNLDVTDPSLYGMVVGDATAAPQPGIWLPPTTGSADWPTSSYAWAEIGVGTIAISFFLVQTTLTQTLQNTGGWFALRLPTSDLGQAWGRYGALAFGAVGVSSDEYHLTGAWVIYEDQWLRFSNPKLTAGTYDIAGSVIVPCDWW